MTNQAHPTPPEAIFEANPMLGAYVAHYGINRNWLLLQAAVFYGVPVGFLQVFFSDLDNLTASIVLIGLYSAIAIFVGWYVLHLWNRAVVLYEKGFSYREGSNTRLLRYYEIAKIQVQVERVLYFGIWRRDLYTCRMISNDDEKVILTNVYNNIQKASLHLETAITAARLPTIQKLLAHGETLPFGDTIRVGQMLQVGEDTLAWSDFAGYRLDQKDLLLLRHPDQQIWQRLPLNQQENLMIFIELLKQRSPQTAITA